MRLRDPFPSVTASYTKLVAVVTAHFNPRTNLELQRFTFHETVQKNQTILEYYAELDALAENCDFHDKNREIKLRMIRGCKSKELQKKAQRKINMTLEQFLDFGRTLELTESAHRQINQATAKLDRVQLSGGRGGRPPSGAK